MKWKCSQPGVRGWEWGQHTDTHQIPPEDSQPASDAVVRLQKCVPEAAQRPIWDPKNKGGRGERLRTVKACPTGQQWMSLWNYPVWLRCQTQAMDAGGLSAGIWFLQSQLCRVPFSTLCAYCPMETCRSQCPSSWTVSQTWSSEVKDHMG